LENRTREYEGLKNNHEKLLSYSNSMSVIKSEYMVQGSDAYMAKNLDKIRIENQDLKLKVQELEA
jgi:hypothetical protein